MPLNVGLHIHFSRTIVFKNSLVNIGIKLYHILPSQIGSWEKYSALRGSWIHFATTNIRFHGWICVSL